MSVVTGTGYDEHKIFNNLERVLFIIYIYIGNAIIGVGFGLFAVNSQVIPTKFAEYYDLI